MKIQAQMAMVLSLDKCIGCHTCSVTCKNVWTSRKGMEYVWFNNVETKPDQVIPYNGKIRTGTKAAGLSGNASCSYCKETISVFFLRFLPIRIYPI